jgi:hypothetical protein
LLLWDFSFFSSHLGFLACLCRVLSISFVHAPQFSHLFFLSTTSCFLSSWGVPHLLCFQFPVPAEAFVFTSVRTPPISLILLFNYWFGTGG